MVSQLITPSWSSPFAGPTGTSVLNPRTVLVIGATVSAERNGATVSRVSNTTGRVLSILAKKIGRTNQSPVVSG